MGGNVSKIMRIISNANVSLICFRVATVNVYIRLQPSEENLMKTTQFDSAVTKILETVRFSEYQTSMISTALLRRHRIICKDIFAVPCLYGNVARKLRLYYR